MAKVYCRQEFSTKASKRFFLHSDVDISACNFSAALFTPNGATKPARPWTVVRFEHDPKDRFRAIVEPIAGADSIPTPPASPSGNAPTRGKGPLLKSGGGSSSGELTITLTDPMGHPVPFSQADSAPVTVTDS